MPSHIHKITWFFLCYSSLLFSQQIAEFNEIKERFHDDKLVRLNNVVEIEIHPEGDELKITRLTSSSTMFLNENAKQYAKESVSYSAFIRLDDISANTQYLEDGKYATIKIDEFLKKNELDGSFHDDVSTVNFIYPKMGQGSITNLETSESILNPRFLGSFYFGGYHPVIQTKLIIKVDNTVNLSFKQFNTQGLDIQFQEEKKKKYTTYTWESGAMEGIEMENNTPDYKNYYPHVHAVIDGYYDSKGSYQNIASTVADLYSWYSSMAIDGQKTSYNQELESLVQDLTKGITDEKEKVRAIYYWVQDNIKYIAYEYALGGFIPREAQTVFTRKFGDCKDNSNLLYEMLGIAGIESSLTWIGTRSIPYKYEELPTPAVDNHMILAYKNADETFYMDATGRYLPLEYPSSFIQGKEALVGISTEEFLINEVPVVPADKNKEVILSTIEIVDTSIKGNCFTSYQGYPKMDLYYALENVESKNDFDEFYKLMLELGSNKFSYSNLKETNKYDYDKNFEITYDFQVDDIVTKTSNELMLNLNLDKRLLEEVIGRDRKTDIEKEYQQAAYFKNTLQIPEGYTPDYIPENLRISSEYLDVSISYELAEDQIIYTHEIVVKELMVPKEDFTKFNKVIKSIESAYKELTVLKIIE